MGSPRPVAEEAIDRIRGYGDRQPAARDEGRGDLAWSAMLRKLDRVNPGYDA
jgi:hypothetical protein